MFADGELFVQEAKYVQNGGFIILPTIIQFEGPCELLKELASWMVDREVLWLNSKSGSVKVADEPNHKRLVYLADLENPECRLGGKLRSQYYKHLLGIIRWHIDPCVHLNQLFAEPTGLERRGVG